MNSNRSLNVKDFLQPVILNKSPLFRTRTVKVLSLHDILECKKLVASTVYLVRLFPGCLSFVAKATALLQLQNTILTTESRNASTETAKRHSIQAACNKNLGLISCWDNSSDSSVNSEENLGIATPTFDDGRRTSRSDKNGGKQTKNNRNLSLFLRWAIATSTSARVKLR